MVFTKQMPFLSPNQGTEKNKIYINVLSKVNSTKFTYHSHFTSHSTYNMSCWSSSRDPFWEYQTCQGILE